MRPLHVALAGGNAVTVFSKTAAEWVPLWDAVVAPHYLLPGLVVESWLHGPGRMPSHCGGSACVLNNLRVRLPQRTAFGVMQDHSKWAVGCGSAQPTVLCFGDHNREAGQLRRGGTAVCFAGQSAAEVELYDWFAGIVDPERVCTGCACHALPPVRALV